MNCLKRIVHNIKSTVLNFFQERINRQNRERLLGESADMRSIIASNCIGGYISHYLKLRFMSPTVNLFITPADYITMLKEFDKFFDPNAPITQAVTEKPYPVGDIYGCKIHFMHYKSFESAVNKWRERCSRINKNALYIIMTDRDGCTLEDLKAFDGLEYKNKVVFTCREYSDIPSSFYIRGFEKRESVGHLHSVMSITGKRYIDQFDYVEFLNRGIEKEITNGCAFETVKESC